VKNLSLMPPWNNCREIEGIVRSFGQREALSLADSGHCYEDEEQNGVLRRSLGELGGRDQDSEQVPNEYHHSCKRAGQEETEGRRREQIDAKAVVGQGQAH